MKQDLVEEEMLKPEYGPKTKKHLTQVSSILGLLQYYNLMEKKTCFIEFGAGRGKLYELLGSVLNTLIYVSS